MKRAWYNSPLCKGIANEEHVMCNFYNTIMMSHVYVCYLLVWLVRLYVTLFAKFPVYPHCWLTKIGSKHSYVFHAHYIKGWKNEFALYICEKSDLPYASSWSLLVCDEVLSILEGSLLLARARVPVCPCARGSRLCPGARVPGPATCWVHAA